MQQRIGIPYELHPSCLLWTEELSPAGRDIRRKSSRLGVAAPAMLHELAQEAEGLLVDGDANSCATVLICIADHARDAGELALARQCCERAEIYFCCYEGRLHRHNHAVALYALGLVCQFQGLMREAIGRYDHAVEQFVRARSEWIQVRGMAYQRISQCNGAVRWVKRLRENLASETIDSPAVGVGLVSLPVLSAVSAANPLDAGEEFGTWVDVDEARAGPRFFALRVEGDRVAGAGIRHGDVVLIRESEDWPADGQIALARIAGLKSGSLLGTFYRQSDHSCLQPANRGYSVLVVISSMHDKERIEADCEQLYPKRRLDFQLEASVQCLGWYSDKV